MEEVVAAVLMEDHSEVAYRKEEEVEVVVVGDSLKVQELVTMAESQGPGNQSHPFGKARIERNKYRTSVAQ